MTCTRKQVRTLMKHAKTKTQEGAAAKAGMALETAKKYLRSGGRMAEKKPRDYRTREDCFTDAWPNIEQMLGIDADLQSQTLMQWLIDQDEQKYSWGQLRTLQRRIQKWRALKGPDQAVMFPQQHIPGKMSQSDWTHCNKLEVTIDGQPYDHMLFHFMLPYSRW